MYTRGKGFIFHQRAPIDGVSPFLLFIDDIFIKSVTILKAGLLHNFSYCVLFRCIQRFSP
jgi:hypothetical protein